MSFEESGKHLDEKMLLLDDLTAGVGNIMSRLLRLEGRVEDLERQIGDDAPPPEPSPDDFLWLSPDEIAALPTEGAAWTNVLQWASRSEAVNLWDRTSNADAIAVASALVYARTGSVEHGNKAIDYINELIATNFGDSAAHVLPLSRNLAAYVVAAELMDLPNNHPVADSALRGFLVDAVDAEIAGRSGHHTLRESALFDPTNHGTHARPCAYIIARYLGDDDLALEVEIAHSDWVRGQNSQRFDWSSDTWWQADPSNPVAINPPGATIEGHDVSGALTEEYRREGSGFMWPPGQPTYPWEALQGAFLMSWLLYRKGYLDVWEWGDQALLRAVQFNYDQANLPASGDDLSLVYLINQAYNTNYPTTEGTDYGKSGLGMWELIFSR